MSSQRRNRGTQRDVINGNGTAVQEITESAFVEGAEFKVPINPDKIRKLPIGNIYPDLSQPRRTMPTAVRQSWGGDPATTETLFATWIEMVAQERGNNTSYGDVTKDIDLMLAQPGQYDQQSLRSEQEGYDAGPIELSLMRVVDLAASIQANGLINPVTVFEDDIGQYVLETGERRWLAFHLLHIITDDEAFALVPARQQKQVDVWNQAFENNVRADLNAISKARQLAILLMDLYRNEGTQFTPYNQCGSDREYYEQVADADTYRVPRGYGDAIFQATGLPNRSALTRHRKLLQLPDIVWQVADDLDWPENTLREFVPPVTEDDAVRKMCEIVQKSRYMLPVGNICEGFLIPDNKIAVKPSPISLFKSKLIPTIESRIGKMNRAEKRQAIDVLRKTIEDLESSL